MTLLIVHWVKPEGGRPVRSTAHWGIIRVMRSIDGMKQKEVVTGNRRSKTFLNTARHTQGHSNEVTLDLVLLI